ncbi:MAG: GAF domain-containing protein [Candidatus Eremiobacteraeota bacterium]|nr:GAF domain-containing protein [Candidatus Eremiobacteraeota bacterium]
MLKHRLFDIDFVLNRAAIYTTLTAILLPLFALLEWLVDRYISTTNHTESLIVQVGIVLVLFFSFRWLHGRTEGIVDDLLFRERHASEAALREFALHTSYITDADSIVSLATATVAGHTKAAWAAIYGWSAEAHRFELRAAAEEPEPPESIPENDLGVVALRAKREPVQDVHRSDLKEALLCPFASRGNLTGFLACGPKKNQEEYAPDERAVLAEVAQAVGSALEGLRVAELETENARLRAELNVSPRPIEK